MPEEVLNLANGQRAQRKTLITVAEWGGTWSEDGATYTGGTREIMGVRTEDSSIEFNPDTETVTDILGITYTDVNKTEPQQDFDPLFIIGGSKLSAYMTSAALENRIDDYNNVFNIYVITAFIGSAEDGYKCVMHKNSTILPTSIGGDSYVSLPVEVHYSNNIVSGTVDKLSDNFTFTAANG